MRFWIFCEFDQAFNHLLSSSVVFRLVQVRYRNAEFVSCLEQRTVLANL